MRELLDKTLMLVLIISLFKNGLTSLPRTSQ